MRSAGPCRRGSGDGCRPRSPSAWARWRCGVWRRSDGRAHRTRRRMSWWWVISSTGCCSGSRYGRCHWRSDWCLPALAGMLGVGRRGRRRRKAVDRRRLHPRRQRHPRGHIGPKPSGERIDDGQAGDAPAGLEIVRVSNTGPSDTPGRKTAARACCRRPRRTSSTPSRPRPASGSAGTGSTAELLVAVSVKEAMSLPARSWSATASSPGVGSV